MTTDDRHTWWPDWAENFALLFGLTSDTDMQMLALWADHFRPYTQDEMDAATRKIVSSGEKFFKKQDILAALQLALKELRLESESKNFRRSSDKLSCSDCSDTGFISGVPTIRDGVVAGLNKDGTWSGKYTTAILCHCALGQYKHTSGATQITFNEYDAINPGWRVQVFEHQQRQKAEQAARLAAEKADGLHAGNAFDAIIERLRKRSEELKGGRDE